LAGAQIVANDPVVGKKALNALAQDLADSPNAMKNFSLMNEPLDALVDSDGLLIVT